MIDKDLFGMSNAKLAATLLRAAADTIDDGGERNFDYGDILDNARVMADYVNFRGNGPGVSPIQMVNALQGVKIARLKNSPGHLDSKIDLLGYMALEMALLHPKDGS